MKNKKVRLVIIITLIITITSFYSMNIMAADVNDSSSDTNTEALQNNSQTTSADQSTDTSVKAKSETPNTANTDSSTMKSSKTVKAFKAKATTIKNDYNFKSDWTNKISDSKTLKYNYIDSDNETFVNSSFYNNSLKLGLAGNFAIVGYSKVKNSAHTNGNILTSELEYGSNFGCNQENGQVSYIKKFTNIANYTAGPHPAADLLVVGNSVGVGLEDNNTAFSFNGSKINSPYNVAKDSTTKQYLDMDTAKNESINISQTLASYKNQGIAQNLTTNNITLTNDTNGYLNVYNATAGDINSSKINVKLSDTKGTSTLINIDAKGTSTINLQGLNLYINGTPLKTVETGEYSGGKIIINVYDSTRSDKLYTGTVNIAGATYASILAPHATLNLNSNVNGTVIGDVVNINAESHQTNFTGTLRTLPTTISKTVVKKWSDNNNLDGLRPSSVDVQLYANGTAVGEKETLDADNDWTYKWPELEQYSNGTEIKYTVKEISNVDGYLTTYSDDTFTITNTQETKTVKFSKTAVNGTKELEGAKLKVVKGNSADGDEVGSWTSTDQMHELSLNYGETYTMVETTAPDNYDKAESITFTINKDGKVVIGNTEQASDIVKMQDAVSTTSVSFSKTDINGTSELKGAKLKVITALGVVVDEWTSGSSAHEISGLKYGETYIMVETTAPDNYDKAESIMFTINKDGKVVIGNTEQASNKVVMQDAVSKKTVKFSKTAVNGTKELEGAKLKVVKGNSADGDEVGSWTSTDQMHELSLNYGETYTMVETTAPEGYDKAESITFTIDKDGNIVIDGKTQDSDIVKMQDATNVSKTVKKVWNDNDNKSGYRPDSIKVQLYVNGVAKGDPEMLNAANGWKYTWSALARTLEGKEINYTVKEVTELSNYVTTYSDDTFTITNSLKSSGSGGNNAYNHNSGKPNNNVPGKPDSNNNGKPNISNLSNPNTGDDTNLWLQLSILGLALTGLGTSFYTLHRKEKD